MWEQGKAMITKLCKRCKRIIPYGTTYCIDCQPIVDEQKKISKEKRAKHYDQKIRDKQSTAFYNSAAWRLLSRTRLQKDEYKCQVCGALASEVHHIKSIKKHWHLRLDISNLMSVCTPCHNKMRNDEGEGG